MGVGEERCSAQQATCLAEPSGTVRSVLPRLWCWSWTEPERHWAAAARMPGRCIVKLGPVFWPWEARIAAGFQHGGWRKPALTLVAQLS